MICKENITIETVLTKYLNSLQNIENILKCCIYCCSCSILYITRSRYILYQTT